MVEGRYEMDNTAVGNKIRELRKAKGFSQYQLGKLLGLSDKAVSKWEQGLALPRRTACEKLSGCLGFDFSVLIDDELSADESEQLVREQVDKLWDKAEKRMKELYGEDMPFQIENRFLTEKNILHCGRSIILFDILAKVHETARQKGARFRSTGCECFTAWLLGATDVNPLEPHLRCNKCRKVEFHPEVQSGWDLQEKECECGGRMEPDGHGIPVELDVIREGPLYEYYRCPVDTGFMNEAERIIINYGEQFFRMERYHEDEEKGFLKDPETGTEVYDNETGKKIPIYYLPLSVLVFRRKKKAKARKPEKISGPTEMLNWGREEGAPAICLEAELFEPYYIPKPSPFKSDPRDLVQPEILDRALTDYWIYMKPIMNERTNTVFPDLAPYLGKLTFAKYITLICSIDKLYMCAGPEELAEKCNFEDLTDLPLTMEDIWTLISRCGPYPGYLSGAAGEMMWNIRAGQYLVTPFQDGPSARDLKLFKELGLPEWFTTLTANVYGISYRSVYIDMGIRLLEDARKKIRERK